MKLVDDPALRDMFEKVIGSGEDLTPFFVKSIEHSHDPFSHAIQSIKHDPDVVILMMSDREKAEKIVKFMNSRLDVFSPNAHPRVLALKILQIFLFGEI